MSERNYWLIKSEPSVYAWDALCADGRTVWNGVRNFEARNNLRKMQLDDRCLYYHSNEGKEIVGISRVVKAAYPDPTAPGEDWSVVDIAPDRALSQPVTLETIRDTAALANMSLLKRSRLSVTPVTKTEFNLVCKLGKTKP